MKLTSLLAATLLLAACAAPLANPSHDAQDWPIPTGDLANTRHSALTQITPANVARLQPAWHFATGAPRGQEGGPLVADGLLYLHTPFPNKVIAIALSDHSVRWTYEPRQSAKVAPLMCCDVVSRGLAYGRGKVFLQQADATLVALDAKTGARLWEARNGSPRSGATATNAPQLFDRYVITGISGGEYGVRGYISAFDAETGQPAWRGYSVGPDSDLLVDPARSMTWRDGKMAPVGADSSLKTWQGDQWKTGGGTTWGWYSYDPDLRLMYYGSGNPGTWNPLQRPGDNKWATSLWARDIDSGRVRWVVQMTPHDEWDYDGVNESILFDAHDASGRQRRMLAHFDRNGFAYALDRESGELLSAEKFDPSVNWASRIDIASGRPVVVPEFSPAHQGEDETTQGVCPPAIGGKNQAPAAYDPALGLFFVPGNHLCMDIEPFHIDYTAGQPFVGASISMHPVPGDEDVLGRFIAWDAVHGKLVWSQPEAAPVWSGALSTASGLVFYGTLDGRLKALDAKTGQVLWVSPELPSGVVGNVTTWAWQGRQFVGVLTGVGGLADDPEGIGALRKSAAAMPPSRGELMVFALPDE